ncbi:R3H domain-containing protein 2-like isoform X2 [Bicyclus anynana]|uniref:R3H domain-containing protein 2-like isoform X2 n=1 Tax=Bicyclus anynana TaxID=110368 RepID=A0ABM3LUM8_BICAN|nr:R3H domain-containing protein 2-like isoform X2 [Bicyclus anynana]
MEQPEVVKNSPAEDAGLSRNRSFKSKQLVRSQAIRESTSPPRTVSPYATIDATKEPGPDPVAGDRPDTSDSSRSDRCSVVTNERCDRKPVEIQITRGSWEAEAQSEQRLRTRRWLGQRPHSDSSRDLLSYNPRVACVCGACACPHCRGRRRKHLCPTKQDSGIVCSDDCPDCTDSEHAGPNGDGARKSGSFDADEQTFYCRCPERKDPPKNLSLGAYDQEEPTGSELVKFLKETLNKNPKDRITLLRIEKELHSLVNDAGRCIVRFPVMTSYGRMLVHRCAALFQLAHHPDHSNKNSVLVSKSGTSGGRIPCTSFHEWCTYNFPRSPPRRHEDTHTKSILKRCEGGTGSVPTVSGGRSKSLEQREREYERVRRRIFSTDNCTQDESQWPWLAAGPVKLLTPDNGRNKLLKVQSLESRGGTEGAGVARGPVSKSHSFGGYTAEPQPQQRMLSKQGDQALSSWRLSPSSSGYKTLSLRSTDSVTPSPSPTGGTSPEPGIEATTLVWAVTNMSAVPPGALVIHPQTCRPLTNPDGSVYHFDPNNPPLLYNTTYVPNDEKADLNNEARRGKLEKQNSFIDNECECQPTEECRIKCCCECRRRECCQKTIDKGSPQKPKSTSNPSTPVKTHNEVQIPTTPEPKPDTPQNQTTEQITEPQTTQLIETNHQNQQPIENQNDYDAPNSTNESPSNLRPLEPANQGPVYEQRVYDSNNQRAFENRYEVPNQTVVVKMPEEAFQENYVQGYRNEDIISPQSMIYPQPDLAEMQNMIQAKVTPIPVPDPNMRPMSLTNVVYPTSIPPPNVYPYVNPCRMGQSLQPAPIYQPMMQQPEEQKQVASSPHNDNTFRIDPSYPYAADFSAACGACDSVTIPQPRGYNVPYGQVEVQPGMQPYAVPNVLIQPQMQHYQYQEQVPIQWQSVQPPGISSPAAPKVMLHDVYPVVYPNVYQPYNIVYPQVLPQAYPIVQQMYPIVEKQHEMRRNSFHRPKRDPARATPQTPSDDDTKKDERQSDIAMKIQQIKDQMSQMNTKERGRNEWRRRNSGSGILGSYPVNFNGRVVGPHEEVAMSPAARAIVHSIRSINPKGNYYQHEGRRFEPRGERHEFRRVRPFAPHAHAHAPRDDDERRERRPHPHPQTLYRPPYIFRQMSPGAWCRRSPGPVPPAFNQPRRPYPDARNMRR